MTNLTDNNTVRKAQRGNVSNEHLIVIVATALVGIGAMTSLGTAEQDAILGKSRGAPVTVPVTAATAEADDGHGGAAATDETQVADSVTVDAESASSTKTAQGADATKDHAGVDSDANGEADSERSHHGKSWWDRATGIVGSGLGLVAGGAETFANATLGALDIGDRFAAGLADGVWDALFEVGNGLFMLGKNLVWDFGIEDINGGLGGILGKAGAWAFDKVAGTHTSDAFADLSWIPLKDAAESFFSFGKNIPAYFVAFGKSWWNVGGNLVACVNPVSGDSSQKRGHACGDVVPTALAAVAGVWAARGVIAAGTVGGSTLSNAAFETTQAALHVTAFTEGPRSVSDRADGDETTEAGGEGETETSAGNPDGYGLPYPRRARAGIAYAISAEFADHVRDVVNEAASVSDKSRNELHAQNQDVLSIQELSTATMTLSRIGGALRRYPERAAELRPTIDELMTQLDRDATARAELSAGN